MSFGAVGRLRGVDGNLRWLVHFIEWQRSGVSLHAFCRSRRLSYSVARAWQGRLARLVLGPVRVL